MLTITFFFFEWIIRRSAKIAASSAWHPDNENDLKSAIKNIYSTQCLETLKNVVAKEKQLLAKHSKIITLAGQERQLELSPTSAFQSFALREKITRRIWLFVLLLSFLIYPLAFLGISLWQITRMSPLEEVIPQTIGVTVILVWTLILETRCLYYCAYKNKGNGMLITSICGQSFSLFCHVMQLNKISLLLLSEWGVYIVTSYSISIIYIYSSSRLKKINEEAKLREQLVQARFS
jgi:hypothetical protein